MNEVNKTGGARIGLANATWPFAKLKVSKDRLELNATIIGKLVFKPDDIISIQPYYGYGIKINHRVSNYSKKVVFSNLSPHKLLQQIKESGFLNNTEPIPEELEKQILEAQLSGGFPLKKLAAFAIILIWNALFLLDFTQFSKEEEKGFGEGAQLALGFILGLSALLLVVKPLQTLILKQGRSIKDIKLFLYFIILISGIMFLSTIGL